MNHVSELSRCFNQDFESWLLNSNCPGVGPYKGDWWRESSRMRNSFSYIRKEVLQKILDILVVEPNADHFWYSYQGELTYSMEYHQVVPSDSLRTDKEKIKVLLRDIKLNQIIE